ncbi:hypothetical protein M3665_22950, partial [Bacillus licheniformis]|nr:hypothetical protein [Bacillus licheniformis]
MERRHARATDRRTRGRLSGPTVPHRAAARVRAAPDGAVDTRASTVCVTGQPRRSAIIPHFYEAGKANDHGSGT